MLVHDLIKIKYVNEGYLPNYPYHLISDEEMCRAFINVVYPTDPERTEEETPYYDYTRVDYFSTTYPLPDDSLSDKYEVLKNALMYHMSKVVGNSEPVVLPDWVYSFMLGKVIGPYSEQLDRHDMLVMMNLDNLEDELDAKVASSIYDISKSWIRRYPVEGRFVEMGDGKVIDTRPPSLFGEPHVLKSLRLQQLNLGEQVI